MRQLLYFVTVADARSFSRGAVTLNLARPSLSRQIALLEADLGQRLLVRTGRGVAPTEAGEALLVHARAMVDISRRARDELRQMDESPGGRIVVGMPPRVALGLSTPLIQRFRDKFPRAVITVLEGLSVSLRESLIAGRLDMALLFDPAASPQLAFHPLMREKLLLAAPPGSRLPARVGLAQLANYPMVLPSAPNAIRHRPTPFSSRVASNCRSWRRSGPSRRCSRSSRRGWDARFFRRARSARAATNCNARR